MPRIDDARRVQLIKRAIDLLYDENASWEEIARNLGISRTRLNQWRLTNEWKRAEIEKRRALKDEAIAGTSQVLKKAVDVLVELMQTSENERIRLAAAQKLIDLTRLDQEEEPDLSEEDEYAAFLKLASATPIEIAPGGILHETQPPTKQPHPDRVPKRSS